MFNLSDSHFYHQKGQFFSSNQREELQGHLTDNLPKLYRTRIEIMLLADEGKTQSEICKELGCTSATANRWILLASSGKSHEWKDYRRGRPQKVTTAYLQRLRELASCSPRDFGYSFRRWTGEWLAKHLEKEFGIKLTKHHINRLLKDVKPIQIKDLSSPQK